MSLSVEQAVTRVPLWQGLTDIQISTLEGGITNRNYCVRAGGKSYHLRLAGEDTQMLGIDRDYEYLANKTAGEIGIAPEVVYFIRPEGYLITRFIEGRPIPPEEIRRPENLRRVAETLLRVHAMPGIPGVFSPFEVVRQYAEIARGYGVPFPMDFVWLTERMDEAEAALGRDPLPLRPCHNDLLNANFIVTDTQLFILDWEYAGMGDIFFDLANFSAHHELTEQEIRLFLDCYFGEVAPRALAHLRVMKVMSDLREAMWALVQIGISDLDFDYQAYADRFFARARESMHHPDWQRWLKEVL